MSYIQTFVVLVSLLHKSHVLSPWMTNSNRENSKALLVASFAVPSGAHGNISSNLLIQ